MQLEQFDTVSKIRFHHEWLEAYRAGKVVAPISVEMDLTNRCNYSCPNCVWGSYITGNRAHVPSEQALQQVRECAEIGVKAIAFSGGGEPLLNAATPTAIELAKSLGLNVGLFTNGVLIKPDVAYILAKCCDWIRIHLDGASPETYARRHGLKPTALNTVVTNLSGLNRIAKELNSVVEVGIGSVINPDNFSEVEELANISFETGCKYFQAKHDFELLSEEWYTQWWNTEVVLTLRRIEESFTSSSFQIQYTITDYTRKPTARTCHIHHLTTAINAEGQLAYCKRLRDRPEWSPGNLREKSLKTILEGDENEQLSQEITPHNCGINCPYLELNEYIDRALRNNEIIPLSEEERARVKHPNNF